MENVSKNCHSLKDIYGNLNNKFPAYTYMYVAHDVTLATLMRQPPLPVTSQQQLSAIISFTRYSEKVTNDLNKWELVLYLINNIDTTIVSLKQNILNLERSTVLAVVQQEWNKIKKQMKR